MGRLATLATAANCLKDPVTGCRICADEADPKTNIATWSGDCEETAANGIGSLVWFKEGSVLGRYDEDMKGGRIEGHCVLFYRAKDNGYDG